LRQACTATAAGLYLQVTKGGDAALHRSWLYRFAIAGRERQMGLGSFPTVGIAEARAKAADALDGPY
jgi:hypothetical protein